MAVITISRQLCSYGDEIAEAVAHRLGWTLLTRESIFTNFFEDIVTPHQLHMLKESVKFFTQEKESGVTYLSYVTKELQQYATRHSLVLLGFGTQLIFADDPNALHFRIIASQTDRIHRVKSQYHVNDEQAVQIIKQSERKRRKYVTSLYDRDVTHPGLYHLTFNTSVLSPEESISAMVAMAKERELRQYRAEKDFNPNIMDNSYGVPLLKNRSEIEFAKILDMYQIEWQYEPKTFPIEWDDEGNVISAFSPDFYLTKFDTYIELTTMNQKYVTEKNNKIKKVKKLYPGTNIKIVYKKDFHTLVERLRGM